MLVRCSSFLLQFCTFQCFLCLCVSTTGLLRGSNVSHQIEWKALVPSAQYHQNFCVVLTRGHHVRHLHESPEVVSLSQQATCQEPLQGELVLSIPQSANLCVTAHPDTSCNQVFANRIPSSAQEHFSTLAVRLRIIQRTHATHMMTLHSVWMQSNHLI